MSTRSWTIRSLLRAKLLDLSGLPTIQWQNQSFRPPVDDDGLPQTYVRETLMPNDEFLSANNEKTSVGIYQIDVIAPIDSKIEDAENLADDIKELFKPAQTLSELQIEKSALLQSKVEKSWYIIPVRVFYRAHQTNT